MQDIRIYLPAAHPVFHGGGSRILIRKSQTGRSFLRRNYYYTMNSRRPQDRPQNWHFPQADGPFRQKHDRQSAKEELGRASRAGIHLGKNGRNVRAAAAAPVPLRF